MVPQSTGSYNQLIVPTVKVNYLEQESALVFVQYIEQYNPEPLLRAPRHCHNTSKGFKMLIKSQECKQYTI